MIRWLFPMEGNATLPIARQNAIKAALEILPTAPYDQFQAVLEQKPLLMADDTLITLCLTLLHGQDEDDTSTNSSLVAILTLLDNARTQGIVAACAQLSEQTGD